MATAEFSKFAGILSAALSQHHLSGQSSSGPKWLVFCHQSLVLSPGTPPHPICLPQEEEEETCAKWPWTPTEGMAVSCSGLRGDRGARRNRDLSWGPLPGADLTTVCGPQAAGLPPNTCSCVARAAGRRAPREGPRIKRSPPRGSGPTAACSPRGAPHLQELVMDREARHTAVRGVTKRRTRLTD